MKNGTYMHVYMYMYIEFTDYAAVYMYKVTALGVLASLVAWVRIPPEAHFF